MAVRTVGVAIELYLGGATCDPRLAAIKDAGDRVCAILKTDHETADLSELMGAVAALDGARQ